MPYTPQVRINPSFAQYMSQRTNPYAYAGQGGSANGLTGGSFGFPNFYNPYGGQQWGGGGQPGAFGMPQTFYPGQQQQQQTQQQQQPQQPQSMVQQVAGATDYSQPNINFGDQGQRQTFLDEYKKLYMDQLGSKDPTYKKLATAQQNSWNAYNNAVNATNTAWSNAPRDKATGVALRAPPNLTNVQNLDMAQGKAAEAKDAYFNNLWKGQQAQLDSLFSGQITPQMLLQGMTRGLLG